MRRMLRTLKWLGLSLSTLLLAGTVFCWVRSLGQLERWRYGRFEPRPDWITPDLTGLGVRHHGEARLIHGWLWLESETWQPSPGFEPEIDYWHHRTTALQAKMDFEAAFAPRSEPSLGGCDRLWQFAGAGFRHRRSAVDPRLGRPNGEGITLALPFWMLAVIFGLWPAGFVAWRLLRKKRHAPGHCAHCGYDLRATPDPSGPRLPRCPECGRETAAAVPTQPTPR